MFRICRNSVFVSVDEKYFGADIDSFLFFIHGAEVNLHPHLRCVVPGGGYSKKKEMDLCAEQLFVPVEVLKKDSGASFYRD